MMPRGLDTYLGRTITRTETDSEGNWFVELEGGVRVINNDKTKKLPAGLPGNGAGLLFTNLILDENQTQMVFQDSSQNEWRIALNAMAYQIFDDGQSWAPQSGIDPLPTVPDPSAERVVDGPEEQIDENNV